MPHPLVRRSLALAGAIGLFGVSALLAQPALAADAQVFTRSTNVFDPATVTVNAGDTVTWSNPASNGGIGHTVTSTSDNWSKDSPIAVPGSTTSFTFAKAGTYTYVCETHAPNMKGTVVVKAASSPKPTPTRTTSSPRPSPTRTTSSPTPTQPTPSGGSGTSTTPPLGSPSPGSPSPKPTAPSPSLAPASEEPQPNETGDPDLLYAGKGVTPSPPTGRERGLPLLVAVLVIGGVTAGEVRTLRATQREA